MPKRCLSWLLIVLVLLVGCTRSPQRLPPESARGRADWTGVSAEPPAFVMLPAEQAIPQLIAAEREASRQGNLPPLAQLWAEDARIIDSRGTDDSADDFTWPNRAAILDRYTLAVFPAPPSALEGLPAPAITVQGDSAQAVNGQDRWGFVQREGRWWIAELRY